MRNFPLIWSLYHFYKKLITPEIERVVSYMLYTAVCGVTYQRTKNLPGISKISWTFFTYALALEGRSEYFRMFRMFVCQPGRVMYSTSTSAKVSMLATTKRTNRNNVNMILERLQQKGNSQFAHYLNSSCNYKKVLYQQKGYEKKSLMSLCLSLARNRPVLAEECPYAFHSPDTILLPNHEICLFLFTHCSTYPTF